MIVAGAGDAGAQQSLPPIDGAQHGRAEDQELHVVVRRVAGAEQVVAELVGQRPVVVLTGSVDARKRLLVQQGGQAGTSARSSSTSPSSSSGDRRRGWRSRTPAISHWLGATSLCRVLTSTPTLNSSSSASAMHASTRAGMCRSMIFHFLVPSAVLHRRACGRR